MPSQKQKALRAQIQREAEARRAEACHAEALKKEAVIWRDKFELPEAAPLLDVEFQGGERQGVRMMSKRVKYGVKS